MHNLPFAIYLLDDEMLWYPLCKQYYLEELIQLESSNNRSARITLANYHIRMAMKKERELDALEDRKERDARQKSGNTSNQEQNCPESIQKINCNQQTTSRRRRREERRGVT